MSLVLAAALALSPPEADLLRGIYGVESSFGADLRDGDPHKPICQRSVGAYQVRPIAVRELVRVGRLDAKAIKGFAWKNCAGIRAYLRGERNNHAVAREYLRLMRERSESVEDALCRYNGSRAPCEYADKVLAIARGE